MSGGRREPERAVLRALVGAAVRFANHVESNVDDNATLQKRFEDLDEAALAYARALGPNDRKRIAEAF